MAKFNTIDKRAAARGAGPIIAEATPTGPTHEGAPGYGRDEKSELFLLAVSNMVGEDTFYEKAGARDSRYAQLVQTVAVLDPQWMAGFLGWLREDANMRSASLVGAAEAAQARLITRAGVWPANPVRTAKAGDAAPTQVPQVTTRAMVASVLQRADEPGEFLAYWTARYGRNLPQPIKRGVADAARRLYTPYAALKYDTPSHGFRFGDVLDLTHPSPSDHEQSELFRYLIDRRHNHPADQNQLTKLPMVWENQQLRDAVAQGNAAGLFDPVKLRAAGMTWEDALSLAGSGVDKAKLWTALWPTMGYMALLRNLRNMDEAGVTDAVAVDIAARLANPLQVAKSRQFPYRFLAAYENAPNLRWGKALDTALNLSLANLPDLPGRTLVLIDTSASMQSGLSSRSKMSPAKAAAVFGVALAARCGADLVGFADGTFAHRIPKAASVIREVERFLERTGEVGHGTMIARSVRAAFNKHDRVFIISDMQTMDRDTTSAVPADVPLYGFNLGGYKHTALPAGSVAFRHEFGGLTDATFRMVPLIEAGRRAAWPWLD